MSRLGKALRRIRGPTGAERLENGFALFRHLLEADDRVLRLTADANEMLGGEYLFDAQYLRTLESDLAEAVAAVVHDLTELSRGRYHGLVTAYERVRAAVRASFGTAPERNRVLPGAPLVLDLHELGRERAVEVGDKMARLGEVATRIGLPVPDGVVVTAQASARMLVDPGVAAALAELARDPSATGEAVERAILSAPVPGSVAKAVRRALGRFGRDTRFAVRSSALGEDGDLTFAGQHLSLLEVARDDVLDAWRRVVASLFSPRAVAYRRHHGLPMPAGEMAVGCMVMVPAVASGVAYTVDPTAPHAGRMLVSAAYGLGLSVVGGAEADEARLSREPPHEIVSRDVADKRELWEAAPGSGVRRGEVDPERRAAPAVSDDILEAVAALALSIERHARLPQDVEWALHPDGRVIVVQARPLRLDPDARPRPEEVRRARDARPVLLEGGKVACRGVGAGRVFVVGDDERGEGFGPGDVLVARSASPRLAPLLSRAAAFVSDLGAVTGHLATVARELRVPSLVATGDATRRLAPGAMVTVDADEAKVLAGKVDELLWEAQSAPTLEGAREFRVLRRMLRHVAPLHLTDPGSPGFAPERCRTYHDIVRFAHERALVELARLERARRSGRGARSLDLAVPLDLEVIDLGGGVAPGAPERLSPADVGSRPLAALLRGLLTPGVWQTDPADMDLEGFMASATRAGPLGIPGGGAVERNVAVVAGDYMNLNLRLGYHFNVIDCFLSDRSEGSHIAFRFVGGVTELARRTRRARLLGDILSRSEFRVELHGDLVVASFVGTNAACEDQLGMIGRLVGFSRQLDIHLRDDESVDRLVEAFREGRYGARVDAPAADAPASALEVLVLDDETTVGERVKDFLERDGIRVEVFTDSRSALERLEHKRFDVVVTDLKMEGPTGLDVLAAVRDQAASTQMIVITGYRSFEAEREAQALGAFAFLDKPFHLDVLRDLVKKAARARRRTATLGA